MTPDAVILGGARSLIGTLGGALRPLTAVEPGTHAVRSALGSHRGARRKRGARAPGRQARQPGQAAGGLRPGRAITAGNACGITDGAAAVVLASQQLDALGGSRGLAAICGNGGHGASLAVERVG
jgi:acetyl-CoA acetyltransferase